MDEELLAAEVDAVFAAPRDELVAERDRRAKQLRADGHREEARALQAVRKPTVPAWAVDQLARREPEQVADLLAAGDELRDQQRRAASVRAGGDDLRAATSRVRERVAALRRAAGELLADAGVRPQAHLEEVGQTLFAAAVDPDQHEPLRRGILERPLPPAGFGGLEALVPVDDDRGSAWESKERTATGRGGKRAKGGGERAAGGGKRAGRGKRAEGGDDEGAAERAAEQAARQRERRAHRERERRRAELEERIEELQRARDDHAERAERHEAEAARLRRRLRAAEDAAEQARQAGAETDRELADARAELGELGA